MVKVFFPHLSLILGLLLVFSSIDAQTGTIRGKVTSAETGETLIGANVVLKGTTQGASTDLDGNYTIRNVEPGTYDLVCQFISFRADTIENIKVSSGKVSLQDITLRDASVEMQEVTVQAKREKSSSNYMLTMKKKSAKMMDGISSEQISKSGDGDAAGAVKRVTGISVEGGKYVYVRGLSDRYSQTMLNGAIIPGLDPERNTVQMDLFPTNLIENMTVVKTFTPDLPGNFTGGLVNIETKDFPDRFMFQYSSSVGYNPQVNLRDDFLGDKNSETDWLGFDGGLRQTPDLASQKVPGLYENNELLSRQSKSFNKNMGPVRKRSSLDHGHSISTGNQIDLFGNAFGYIASLTYSKSHSFYDNGKTNRYTLTGTATEELTDQLVLSDTKGTENVLWGGLLNLSYKFSPAHKVNVDLMRNQNGISTAREQIGRIPQDNNNPDYLFHTRTTRYKQRSLSTSQISGEHFFKELGKLKVDWLASYTRSKQNEPDVRFFSNTILLPGYNASQEGDTSYAINPSEYRRPARFYRNLEEDNIDARLHLELPFEVRGKEAKLKAGASQTIKNRFFRERRYEYFSQGAEFEGNITGYLADENMNAGSPGGYLYIQDASEERNRYTGDQNIFGAYGMVDLHALPKLRVIAGARMETTDIFTQSFDEELPAGELKKTDLLPAVHGTYSLTKDMNIRLGYGRTIARPTFRELAPYASFQFVGDYILLGNNELERTLIDNIDLRWELFPRLGEIISISAFYKDFKKPIEKVFNPEAANDELTWRNVEQAKVLGGEVEMRKSLDKLSRLTRDFDIGANFTYVYSQVDIDPKELQNIRATDPDHPDTRDMFGQSPYIINTFLNYTNDSIGLQSNLSFNVSGPKMVVVVQGGTPNVFSQPRPRLDLSLGKELGEHIRIKFKARNLLDPDYKQTYTFKGEAYTFQSYQIGRSYSLGISYTIN